MVVKGYKDTDERTSTFQCSDGTCRQVNWRMRGLNEGKANRAERQCRDADLLLIRSSPFRSFHGPGIMAFSDSHMSISAKLGPNELIILSIIGIVQVVGLVGLYYGYNVIILGGLGMALLHFLFVRAFSKSHTITIAREDVASMSRNGLFVSLQLKHTVAPSHRKIRFFVSKKFRDNFAHDFERVFPGLLK
jgi:hypothetical protein